MTDQELLLGLLSLFAGAVFYIFRNAIMLLFKGEFPLKGIDSLIGLIRRREGPPGRFKTAKK